MLSRIFEIPGSIVQNESHGNILGSFFKRNSEGNLQNKVLINGCYGCGKSSLLFSLAVSFAEEEEKNVLFMAPRKIDKLPVFSDGRPRPLTSVLQRIKMVYLENAKEILKYLASLHIEQTATVDCMIIDDLDFYIKDGQKNEDLSVLARILAYAVDAYEFFRQRNNTSCGVLAISTVYAKPNLYERWMDHVFKINVQKGNKRNHEKEFKLSVLQPSGESLIDVFYTITSTCYTVTQVIA